MEENNLNKGEDKAEPVKNISISEKIIQSIFFTESPKIIAICSMLVTITALIIKCMWFFYEWGFFSTYNINTAYIDMNNGGILYSLLGYIGIAILFLISNCIVYFLLIEKKGLGFIIFFLGEVILFFTMVFILANVNILDALKEMIDKQQQMEYLKMFRSTVYFFLMVNVYGLVMSIASLIYKKCINRKNKGVRYRNSNEAAEINRGGYVRALTIIVLIVLVLVESIAMFFMGVYHGNNKKDFKIITERIDPANDSLLSTNSKFKVLDSDEYFQFYAVLFENNSNYIITYLYNVEDKLYINRDYQKIINKENIETRYMKDINNIKEIYNLDLIKDQEYDENNYAEEKDKMSDSLISAIVGAVIGSLIGGFFAYLLNERNRKKEKINIESHASALLYYDLKSIEYYLTKERRMVNLRYSDDWQNMISNCMFLTQDSIEAIYQIYDEVYNYNDFYAQKRKCEAAFSFSDIPQYKELKRLMFSSSEESIDEKKYNSDYHAILSELKKHVIK